VKGRRSRRSFLAAAARAIGVELPRDVGLRVTRFVD
jgi:hypothetical protein